MSTLNLGNSLILDSDIVVNGGEVKTGATFNGKPVYVKCWETNVGNRDGAEALVLGTINNVRNFVNVTMYNGSNIIPFSRPWSSAQQYAYMSANQSTGNVSLVWHCANTFNFGTVRTTAWYTKTTD